MVQEQTSKIDFQDGGCGGQFNFSNQHDFSYFYIYWSAYCSIINFDIIHRLDCKEMSKIDFHVRPTWISDRHNFSLFFYLKVIRLLQCVSTQVGQRFWSFQNGMIFAIVHLHVNLLLHHEFLLKSP